MWERKKLVSTWQGANFSITQETEIIRKTTVLFNKKSEFLDKSINESKNNILKYFLQIIRVFFSLISTIFILSLKVIEALLYVILIIAKALFYVILIIATSLLYVISFVIKTIGIWLIIMVVDFLKFMWESINSLVVTPLKFMWELIYSLVVKIKMLVSKMQ